MQQSSKQIREQSEEQNESKGEFYSLPENPEGHQGVSFVAEDQTCIALNKQLQINTFTQCLSDTIHLT